MCDKTIKTVIEEAFKGSGKNSFENNETVVMRVSNNGSIYLRNKTQGEQNVSYDAISALMEARK